MPSGGSSSGSLTRERCTIAQVTPYPWEADHDVNHHVAGVSRELARRGHRVLIIAPSRSRSLVDSSRRALREAADDPDRLFDGDEPTVLAVGEVLSLPPSRRRERTLPIDVTRTVEDALSTLPLDLVHVHEPFIPSVSSVALRHSRALNVGTFHDPTGRVLSEQVARAAMRLFYGRLDARLASYQATAERLLQVFPADYELVTPGVDQPPEVAPPVAEPSSERPVHILFCLEEERAALRAFVRGLRRLDISLPWRATIWSGTGSVPPITLRRDLRERVQLVADDERRSAEANLMADADIVVLASRGVAPAPALALRAIAAGAIPLVSALPVYEEVLGDGEYGLLFEPEEPDTLSGQLARLIEDADLRTRFADAGEKLRPTLRWSRVTDDLERVYDRLLARRHDPTGNPALRARLRERELIDVDLHMHTDHSHDCATPVEVLLQTAKDIGLGAIAVTDHNVISGAFEAAERADGIKVIVAEEIKTADQGEVIGLFLNELIPRGLTLEETIAEIKRQGGLVYVPHPFDRLHSVPDYDNLLAVVDQVDAIEVFNARVAVKEFNEEAARFAAKYRIPAGAGSDAHVAQGLGSVRIRMRDFDGPEEFMESLRDADIIRKPASLIYVQALKFLQTKATPAPARRAVKRRRVRRATRNV